jgi:excisionase family DNA binding protein
MLTRIILCNGVQQKIVDTGYGGGMLYHGETQNGAEVHMGDAKKAPAKALAEELTITVEDAAALLGMSRGGAYNAVREGEIPSIRIGRCIRVPSASLRKMLGLDETARDSKST